MNYKTSALKYLLNATPGGYKAPGDRFFEEANNSFVATYKKLGVVIDIELETEHQESTEIFCNVPGCNLTFGDVSSYQTHYNVIHRYICSICKKTLPTNYLLDIHITENHDSFFLARVERGDIIHVCYLENCSEKFRNPQERRQHCIEAHKFPPNFRFEQICAENRKSKNKQNQMEVDVVAAVHSQSSSKLKNFTFGHNKERTFNSKEKASKNKSNDEVPASLANMSSLETALQGDIEM